jgi:spore coat protein U-like protein
MKAVAVGFVLSTLLAPTPALALCSVQLQGVSFGSIDVMRREESTGSIKITCDKAVGFSVEIGGSVSGGQRQMQAAGGGSLRYELYGDPGHFHVWGDGLTIGSPLGGASDGSHAQTFTIYGVVPAQPGTPPGIYVDAPLVSLNF